MRLIDQLLYGAALAAIATMAGAAPWPEPPSPPRASLAPADLAVLVAQGDPLSEAVGLAYVQARGIPAANLIRVTVPAGSDTISDSDFATLKAHIDAQMPAGVQASLVTWLQPSRVVGSATAGVSGGLSAGMSGAISGAASAVVPRPGCAMGITSALAFGYNPAFCGGCRRTQPSAYYDTDTTRPYSDLRIRPAMMLGTPTLEAAQQLIARGLAAEGSAPTGTGWLVRTADSARSVRWPDYPALPSAWSVAPGLVLRFVDASAPSSPQELVGQADVLFYFTGAARLAQLESNQFVPGAVADHLSSFGGFFPDGKGQMLATAWLAAGASASYGTVEEPCNHGEKFPRASVLLEHYLRGATVIEAYWKSVAWPGQGLFVGDPLARPWAHTPTATLDGDAVVLRSRALRRLTTYALQLQLADGGPWRVLGSVSAGQPGPVVWRIPLPVDAKGGRLRWLGPCPLQPAQRCVLAGPAD